jgi:hypothetical protein
MKIVKGFALLAVAAVGSPAAGQEPSLESALPSALRPPCQEAGMQTEAPRPATPAEDRAEAERLSVEASRAAILGDQERARTLLEQAARLDPGSGDIAYRLGRILEGTDAPREALIHFCRYVALDPDGSEAQEVSRRILRLSPRPASVPSAPSAGPRASTALVAGLVVPGLGHIYSHRPQRGALVLLAAGGSVAMGALYTRIEVVCLEEPGPDGCAPEMVLSEEESRPYMRPGLIAAGMITVLAAVDASMGVRGRSGSAAGSVAVTLPLPVTGRDGSRPVLTLDPVAGGSGGALRAAVRFTVP